jgi:hypothetical protein
MPDPNMPQSYEIRPDPQELTHNKEDASKNASTGVDYEPHPEKSIPLDAERQKMVASICALYSGSASEEDMQVYAEKAVYDDPWYENPSNEETRTDRSLPSRSYCDTRYKIAGQWYGIPLAMTKSETLKTEIVQSDSNSIIFKLQQAYTPRLSPFTKPVNSLVTLTLDDEGKIKYHKDMWNEKDYSHEGLGKVMKTLNGDHLTKVCFSFLIVSCWLTLLKDYQTTKDFVDANFGLQRRLGSRLVHS